MPLPFDTWNLSETQGNVFGNPRFVFNSTQTLYQRNSSLYESKCHEFDSVQKSTGRLVAKGEERVGSTIADVCKKAVVQQRLQISELQFDKCPTLSTIFVLEDKIQNPGEFLFRFSLGSYVMDQRSGGGRFTG